MSISYQDSEALSDNDMNEEDAHNDEGGIHRRGSSGGYSYYNHSRIRHPTGFAATSGAVSNSFGLGNNTTSTSSASTSSSSNTTSGVTNTLTTSGNLAVLSQIGEDPDEDNQSVMSSSLHNASAWGLEHRDCGSSNNSSTTSVDGTEAAMHAGELGSTAPIEASGPDGGRDVSITSQNTQTVPVNSGASGNKPGSRSGPRRTFLVIFTLSYDHEDYL
jgi:hypothetical protein